MTASTVQARLDRATAPLDRLRAQLFGWTLRSRRLRSLAVSRDRRIAMTLLPRVLLAFVLAAYAPVLLFVLGPIALGVLHVAADVRYLLLRPRLTRWWAGACAAACGSLAVSRALELVGAIQRSERAQFAIVFSWAVAAIVAAAKRTGECWRVLVGISIVATVATIAYQSPTTFRLVLLHGHNLLALLVWPVFFRVRGFWSWSLSILALGGAALLASGWLFRASLSHLEWNLFPVHPLEVADWLAPRLRADHAIGVTSAFVFLQALHYAAWLSVIPQSQTRGQASLSFRMTSRALLADFGVLGVGLVVTSWLLVLGFACADPVRTSLSYVSLAMFHAYLELVLLLYFFVAKHSGARESVRPACR